MLHPADAILISLYSISTHIKVSVVCDGKTKTILFEPSCSRCRIAVISKRIKNRTAGFCLEEEVTKLWFWGTETGRTASKLKLNFDLWNDFKKLEGKGAVYCKQWSRHDRCSVTLFRKSCLLWDNVKTCCTVRQDIGENMGHAHCVLDK